MPDRDQLVDALDAALAALEDGQRLDRVLVAQPELSAELRPLLLAALSAGAGGELARVPAGAQISSRAQFLARSPNGRLVAAAPVGLSGWARLRAWLARRPLAAASPLARALVTSLVVLAGLGAGGYGAVAASAQSLPGDPLYGVKRTVEDTQLLLAPNTGAREQLQAQFDNRRVSEVQALANQHRQAPVDFTGMLISMNGAQSQHWIVSAVAVLVGPQVRVQGNPVLGARVRVQGTVGADGEVQAQLVTILADYTNLPQPTATASPSPNPPTAVPTAAPTFAPQVPVTSAPAASQVGTGDGNQTVASPTQSPQPAGGGGDVSPSDTPRPTEGGGPSPSDTPKPTEDGGGPSPSNTPKATEDGGGGGPSASGTPKATEDGGGGGGGPSASGTPKATEDGGGGSPSASRTPRPTQNDGGGGGASPSTTPKPDD